MMMMMMMMMMINGVTLKLGVEVVQGH